MKIKDSIISSNNSIVSNTNNNIRNNNIYFWKGFIGGILISVIANLIWYFCISKFF